MSCPVSAPTSLVALTELKAVETSRPAPGSWGEVDAIVPAAEAGEPDRVVVVEYSPSRPPFVKPPPTERRCGLPATPVPDAAVWLRWRAAKAACSFVPRPSPRSPWTELHERIFPTSELEVEHLVPTGLAAKSCQESSLDQGGCPARAGHRGDSTTSGGEMRQNRRRLVSEGLLWTCTQIAKGKIILSPVRGGVSTKVVVRLSRLTSRSVGRNW